MTATRVTEQVKAPRARVHRHLAEQSAAIDTDSMKAAQLLGVGVAGDVMKELAARGIVPE